MKAATKVFELYKENCYGDPVQCLDSIDEHIASLEEVDSYLEEIKELRDEYAVQESICPKCKSELRSKTSYESSEYFGTPVRESFGESYCPNCGYIPE